MRVVCAVANDVRHACLIGTEAWGRLRSGEQSSPCLSYRPGSPHPAASGGMGVTSVSALRGEVGEHLVGVFGRLNRGVGLDDLAVGADQH